MPRPTPFSLFDLRDPLYLQPCTPSSLHLHRLHLAHRHRRRDMGHVRPGGRAHHIPPDGDTPDLLHTVGQGGRRAPDLRVLGPWSRRRGRHGLLPQRAASALACMPVDGLDHTAIPPFGTARLLYHGPPSGHVGIPCTVLHSDRTDGEQRGPALGACFHPLANCG